MSNKEIKSYNEAKAVDKKIWDELKTNKENTNNTTDDKCLQVIELIKTTTTNLNKLCSKVGICSNTFYKWMNLSADNELKYANARTIQLERLSGEIQQLDQECIEIIMDESVDPKTKNAVVQAYKLKIDNLKWLLSKLIPKKYGDKLDVTSAGEKIERELVVNTVTTRDTRKDK